MSDDPAKLAFLTTREVADILRVKERKVYEMAAEGEIPCRRVTGKLLFPRAALENWLSGEGGSVAAKAAPAIVAGSHDPLLDWAIRESGSGIATIFDGSLDGVDKILAGEAMAAGLHVFDPAGGDWNLHLAEARLPRAPVALVRWATRWQGLILSPEIDGKVRSVADLRGRRVARRQPSSGAGLLLNHLLEEAGIGADIEFCPDLSRTETDAAAAVASGEADAAPGLEAMARQFGLPFLPTVAERFDLLVDRRSWFDPPLQHLLSFTRDPRFAAKADALGGYDVSGVGEVRWNGG